MSSTDQDTAVESATTSVPAQATVTASPPINDEIVDKRARIFHWPEWQAGMWKGVGIALGVTGLLLIVLVSISIYRITSIIDERNAGDLLFIFSGIGMINNTLLRLLVILIGAGIIFGGLAVSFFSSSDGNKISFHAEPSAGQNFKAMIASHTPGIIGMFLGGIIIVCALFARSTHHFETPARIVITHGNTQSAQAKAEVSPPPLLPKSAELFKDDSSSPTQTPVGKP